MAVTQDPLHLKQTVHKASSADRTRMTPKPSRRAHETKGPLHEDQHLPSRSLLAGVVLMLFAILLGLFGLEADDTIFVIFSFGALAAAGLAMVFALMRFAYKARHSQP